MKMKLQNFYVCKNVLGGLVGFFWGREAKPPQAPRISANGPVPIKGKNV